MRASLLSFLLATAPPLAAQAFTVLTPPTDAVSQSMTAYGLSDDGGVVVGAYSAQGTARAFRWTSVDGAQPLVPASDPFQPTHAYGVSGDGRVVVGAGASGTVLRAYRWTPDAGAVQLDPLPGGSRSSASGVSADGSIVVGFSTVGSRQYATRWTAAGVPEDLGTLPAPVNGDCGATDASEDGSIVVGSCSRFQAGVGTQSEAFRWTFGAGIQGLGDLDGGNPNDLLGSHASAVSDDGNTVIGQASIGSNSQQFRWRLVSGLEGLPFGFTYIGRARAIAISADGRVIGGYDFQNQSDPEAVLWSQATGIVPVRDLVTLPPGVDLADVAGLSADGSVAVGTAFLSFSTVVAWRAEISLSTPADPSPLAPGALAVRSFPNPASGAMLVEVATLEAEDSRVTLHDALGREVAVLHAGPLAAGVRAFALDAAPLAPGAYVLRVATPEAVVTRRATVVR